MPTATSKVVETRTSSTRIGTRRLALCGALLLVAGLHASVAEAKRPSPDSSCTKVQPQDEILLVSTRGLGCNTNERNFYQRIRAERYTTVEGRRRGQWRSIPLDELIASVEPGTPTIFFAHGNRVECNEVRPRALWVYRRLAANRCDDRPIRFIIFSWPSERVHGPLKDTRLKAARTRPAALHLAWLVNQTSPDSQIGFMGYSFGARVMSGAGHLLAGGRLGNLMLPDRQSMPPRPISAVYIAAAFDADWLGRGHYHGRSMEQIDRLLVVTNRRDPAMRLYPLLYREYRAQAMGFEGPTSLTREASSRVHLRRVGANVGRTHDIHDYLSKGGFMSSAWRRLTFADVPPSEFAPPLELVQPALALTASEAAPTR